MFRDRGTDSLDRADGSGDRHGDRLAIDDALDHVVEKATENLLGPGDGVAQFLDQLTDPRETTEMREHALRSLLRAAVMQGATVRQEIDAGNPSGDPDIATLQNFDPELAEPISGLQAEEGVDG